MFWRTCGHADGGVWEHGVFTSHARIVALGDDLARAADPDDRSLACVFIDNSVLGLAAYLGFLRAGHAVYLGDSRSPPARQRAFIEHYRPDIVWGAARPLDSERYHERTVHGRALHLARTRDPAPLHPDLALLLSTSGSTGDPRLVRLGHRAVHDNAESIARALAIDASEVAITTMRPCYAYGLSVVNSHLARGASLVCTHASLMDREFWRLAETHGATSMAGVPYHYQLLRDIDYWHSSRPRLGTYTQAGGALDPALEAYHLAHARRSGARFIVMYGQTEATARISYVPHETLGSHIGAIGVPIPGGQMSIADPDPETGAGELIYRGKNVMMGYATTRECLALGDVLGGVLATGDVVRQGDDGYFWWLGRRTRMAKPFGVRIALDPLEQTLARAFGARVALIADEDENLIAFIEGHEDAERDAALAHTTAADMALPAEALRIVRVDALPRGQHDKVDYRALSRRAAHLVSARTDTAQRGSVAADPEAAISEVFALILGIACPDRDVSFFDLGGHSITGIQLLHELGQRGWHCTVAHLFAHPTIAGLARCATRAQNVAPGARPEQPESRAREMPLGINQRFHWAAQRRLGRDAAYHVSFVIDLDGPLDIRALAAACNALVARHDILRTSYGFTAGRLCQRVHPARPEPLPVVRLETDQDDAVAAAIHRLVRQPIDISNAPLVRSSLVQRSATRHVLVVVAHHIACDGWSRAVLANELAVLYNAHARGQGETDPLPAPASYAEHHRQESETIDPSAQRRARAWCRARAHATPLQLPHDRTPDTGRDHGGGLIEFAIRADTMARVHQLATRAQATLHMVLASAFHVFLWRVSGQETMTIGMPHAHRKDPATHAMVGSCARTLMVELTLAGRHSFLDLVRENRPVFIQGLDDDVVSLEELVALMGRGAEARDWFQVMFVLLDGPTATTSFHGLCAAWRPVFDLTARCPLAMMLEPHGHGLRGSWLYRACHFSRARARAMLADFQASLQLLCDRPGEQLSSWAAPIEYPWPA